MTALLSLCDASHQPGWLTTLAERCATEGVAWPVDRLLQKRLTLPAPDLTTRRALAHLLLNRWVKGHPEVPDWQWLALSDAIEGWWRALPEGADPIGAGLAPAWVRAQTALGRAASLRQAVAAWGDRLAHPVHEELALTLLRHLRRLRGTDAVTGSLDLIDRLGTRWTPDTPWTADIAGSLAMVARWSEDLAELRRVDVWLGRLAPQAGQAIAANWLAPMGAAAVRCLALPVLAQLAEFILAEETPSADHGPTLASSLEALALYRPGAETRRQIERAAGALPGEPGVQVERARLARADGATVQALAEPLLALDPALPDTAAAWQLLAEYAFHDGDLALATTCYERLASLGAIDAQSQMRLDHLAVRSNLPDTSHGVLPEAGPQRVDSESAGLLAEALAPLDAVLAIAPRHDSPVGAGELASRCATALAAFESALPGIDALTLGDAAAAASQLWEMANAGALDLAHWHGVFPFEVGPAFGTLDGHRCRAQSFGVLDHLVALVRHLGRRERPLRGAPAAASLAVWLDLIRQQTDAHLAMKQPRAALADLAEVGERLGTLAEGALAPLREQALLAAGDIDQVRAERPAEPACEVWPMREWADWLACERVSPQALIQDPPCPGRFEVVDVHGHLRSEAHDAVATELSLVPVPNLRVRNVHLLIGERAGILRPHPWHLQMGEFPYPHPNVLNRGAAGTVLRQPTAWRQVDEPLVVLANMDAPFHRNYYHWMVLTLARIESLRAAGHLAERRLLLPRELTGWMLSSLRDIGLTEDRVHWYTAFEDLMLSNAWVASPAEFASPTGVEGLRRRLMQAAGLDPLAMPPGDRLIYLARRGETRRPMVEAETVIDLAESLGFEIVAAESLSLLDQVRLFAKARGIAGPPGAAFTNLMWAPAGTRVLTIFKQDINGPTFFDLSFLRGQHHRWLQARSIAGFDGVSVVTSPFSVDLELARRELLWVRDGDGGRE